MRILVISDTHGDVNRALSAYSLSEPVDCIIHLGDGCADAELLHEVLDVPVIYVAGNCDHGAKAPRERVWECEGKRMLLTHGDAYQVKSGFNRLRMRAEETGVDAVLFGHTHQAVFDDTSGLLLINPGALATYCSCRSYALLTVSSVGIDVLHFNGA